MKTRHLYFVLFTTIILGSCANIIPLEGGPRDTTPPKLIKAIPDTFSLSFHASKIILIFNEFVVISNASKEVFVSPPMKIKPELILKGKSVDVVLKDTLLPNTTYIIRFGKSIADNNEGNIASTLTYVFSTGTFIDSLKIRFKTLDAFTLKPIADATVMLYNTQSDSLAYHYDPYYIGESKADGSSSLEYLANGNFAVVAIKESNRNLRYDKPDEWIGFLDHTVQSGDSVEHRILMFREQKGENKLRFARMIHPGKICFVFQQPVDSAKIEPLTDSLPAFATAIEFGSAAHDSILYWYKPILSDTLKFRIWQNNSWDTISVKKPRPQSVGSGNKGKGSQTATIQPEIPKLEIKTASSADADYTLPVTFIASAPIEKLNPLLATLRTDNSPVLFELDFKDTLHRQLQLKTKLTPGKSYTFTLLPNCLTDLFGQSHDTLVFNIKTTLPSDYSEITMEIENISNTPTILLQWIDEKEQIVQQKTGNINEEGQAIVVFSRILQGKYTLRLIYDTNQNNKWDTGDYAIGQQPEKVSYYPQIIEVKKGFDMTLQWQIGKTDSRGKNKN